MTKIERFEYPLPILKTSVEKLVVETSGAHQGQFVVSNGGGGLLSGVITANSRAVRFKPEEFAGNDSKIEYTLALDAYKSGDIIHTGAVIQTNGGEKVIPIHIKIIPQAIELPEGRVASLKDFYTCARKNPALAGELFASPEFMMWLTATGYEYMDIYDRLAKDLNRPRALENFFILSKLKKRVALAPEEPLAELTLAPLARGLEKGTLTVKKTGWGFVEEPIRVEAPWLVPDRRQLRGEDFDGENRARVGFTVDASQIRAGALCAVRVGEAAFRVEVRRKPYMKAYLSKEYMALEDEAALRVLNNTGEDLLVEVEPRDAFVKFTGRKYLVGKYAEIPFSVKMSAFQLAQLTLKRQPAIQTEITVLATLKAGAQRSALALTIGEF
jgi:hypothetical protein